MKYQEIKKALEDNSSNLNLKIYLGFHNKGGDCKYFTKKLNLSYDSVSDLIIHYKGKIYNYDGDTEIPYEQHYQYKKESNDLFLFNVQSNSDIKILLDNLIGQKDNEFKNKEDKIAEISFYIIEINYSENKSIYLFKKYQSLKQIYSKKIITYQTDSFKLQEDKNLLLVDNKFDFLVTSDTIFIENPFFFKMILGEKTTEQDLSSEALKNINNFIPIDNLDQFQEDIRDNKRMQKALIGISSDQDILDKCNIDKIKNIINDLNLEVKTTDSAIVYDPDHKTQILDLLQDKYLNSPSTGMNYFANSKKKC